jgi:putative ABC transport system substrate-binding protein
MRRRELILGLTGALAAARAACAQDKLPVVAILDAKGTNPLLVSEVIKGLAETGYRAGENVALAYRGVDGHYDRLPAIADEVVRDRATIIIALSVPGVRAAKVATASIPIVFMSGFDPVKDGLVASLNRPGGNITGVSMLTVGLNAKRLQMLRELVPGANRVGFLINPGNGNAQGEIDEMRTAAASLGAEITVLHVHTDAEIDSAFAEMAAQKIVAIVVGNDPFLTSRAQRIVALAARDRVAGIYEWRDFVEAGGLASYGSSRTEDYRMLGVYAGKILNGAKPADLPVAQPTKFELVVNLKTAKSLGLTVPQMLLAQADEVIE